MGQEAGARNQLPCTTSWNGTDGDPQPCAPIQSWAMSTEVFNVLSTLAFAFDVGPSHVPILAELRGRTQAKGTAILCVVSAQISQLSRTDFVAECMCLLAILTLSSLGHCRHVRLDADNDGCDAQVMALALLIYASIATLGYMHWTDRLCPNVTETYFDDLLMQIGKMGVIISVTAGCAPLFIFLPSVLVRRIVRVRSP